MSLEWRSHTEHNCSLNEYNDRLDGSFIRSNARGGACVALWSRGSLFLHAANRTRSGCWRWRSATRTRKPFQSGIDCAQVNGSQVFYQANRDTPIFPEMRALVNKTIGLFGVLRSALRPLSKQIVAAFVYGSVGRQEETAQSDVDLVVVGKATLDQLLSRLSTVEKSLGRPINRPYIP